MITIKDIENTIEALAALGLDDEHFSYRPIGRIVDKFQDGTDLSRNSDQGQIEATYHENMDWLNALKGELETYNELKNMFHAATIDELRGAYPDQKGTPTGDMMERAVAEKNTQNEAENEQPYPCILTDLPAPQPAHFNESDPCILSVNDKAPYPCILTGKSIRMHGLLKGKLNDKKTRKEIYINNPCIGTRLADSNATGFSSNEESQNQNFVKPIEKIPMGFVAPANHQDESQQKAKVGNGARAARTRKPIHHDHLKMVRDYRSYGLADISIDVWKPESNAGMASTGAALFTAKMHYMRTKGEVRYMNVDFQSQRKFRGTLNKTRCRPKRNETRELERFIDDTWYVELNQYVLYLNQIRAEGGLPEVLLGHSQYKQRSKTNKVVWVHREHKRVILLYRDANGNPAKLQMLDGRFVIDFPVLDRVVSSNANAPLIKTRWYRD